MATILIVDDELAVTDILRAVLQGEGYGVVTAKNGQEGLLKLAEERPDLVLCDIMMPLMEGLEMCHLLQLNPSYNAIPVVLMSAAHEQFKGGAARLDLSCDYAAFLAKPFDLDDLLNTVAGLVGRAGAA